MKTYLAKLIDNNWFYLTLLGFVLVLPLSHALVSILGGIVLITALVEDNWRSKFERLQNRKVLLFIPAIFLIYLISSIVTFESGNSLYDLRKTLFFIVFPFAFIFGKEISSKQKRFIFYVFAFSIFISTVVAFLKWIFLSDTENFVVHNIGLISHIRFSFQLILIIWFLIFFIQKNFTVIKFTTKIFMLFLVVYFLFFLFFQQSLTGIVAFGAALVFYLFYLIFRLKGFYRVVAGIILTVIIVIPFYYVFNVVDSFYNIEKIDEKTIDPFTKQGNKYKHDFNNPLVENGNYVFLYVCEKEMRKEWNKISALEFDSAGVNGYSVRSTLTRYLTSRGLKKDAEGVLALTKQDIQNVENGIANYIFQQKKYSLYPRIYQTVWEYYVYTNTGNANYQSFSQRIEFGKAALLIIEENLWFGVGTGNWREAFRNAYHKKDSKLKEELYASSHNQYLNYLVKFGIVGFILILFFLIYPILKTRSYSDKLFLLFLVFMFCANLADSNFESHMGSSFFLFFYCLFLTNDKKEYLKIFD